jgi:hydrogenase maturation protease
MRLIIGLGNPLRSDDGVGAVVAGEAGRQLRMAVLVPQQLLPEHADLLRQSTAVVFVDAASDLEPGVVSCDEVRGSDWPGASHHMTPADLLGLTRDTSHWEPPAWLVRIGAASFDFGMELSPQVAAAVPQAIDLIRSVVPPI